MDTNNKTIVTKSIGSGGYTSIDVSYINWSFKAPPDKYTKTNWDQTINFGHYIRDIDVKYRNSECGSVLELMCGNH